MCEAVDARIEPKSIPTRIDAFHPCVACNVSQSMIMYTKYTAQKLSNNWVDNQIQQINSRVCINGMHKEQSCRIAAVNLNKELGNYAP